MRVLGIDPGTVSMGYALLEEGADAVALDWGAIVVPSSLPRGTRLFQLYSHVLSMISTWQPDEIAVEEPFMGKGQNQFVGPAFAVGQAQALVLIAAAGQDIPVSRYSPAQVKLAIADYGAAPKEQIQEMVRFSLKLDSVPTPSDAADALAIALCHIRRRQLDEVLTREITP